MKFLCNGIGHALLLLLTSLFALIRSFPQLTDASGYTYVTDYFEVPLDHFSFAVNATFKIRYLYNDTYWNKDGNGPIFFYTGNEGAIESFAENTGFMWDIAPEFGAMVVFAEHRFYGGSFPQNFSYNTGENDVLGYLNVEQALADYASLITWLKDVWGAKSSPVIAFGGSYGGQLTTYIRMKYPHLVQGGIAASAPLFLADEGLCEVHDKAVAAVFDAVSPTCSDTIRKSWKAINKMGETEKGLEWLTASWKLCEPLESEDNITTLKNWASSMYADMSMVNYPYPTTFLRALPANPVKAFCHHLMDKTALEKYKNLQDLSHDQKLLLRLFEGLNMYYNLTGSTECLDYDDETSNGFTELDGQSFDYQTCTELVNPACDDGILDFYEPAPWNYTDYAADCESEFGEGVIPRMDILEMFYGGRNILPASNIVFSNGLLDPWHGYGVMKNLSESLIAVVIPNAAHHLDLRGANPLDPPSVVAAREIEKKMIRKWIVEYHENQKLIKELLH